MATRRSQQAILLNNAAVSATNTYTSNWMDISYANSVGFMATFTGTMTGTLTVEASYEATQPGDPGQALPVNFKAINYYENNSHTSVSSTAIAAAGVTVIELDTISATWIRIKYVNATNSGNLTVNAVAKAFA